METANISRLQWPGAEQAPAEHYLELMKRVLTGLLRPQRFVETALPPEITSRGEFQELVRELERHNCQIVRRSEFNVSDRVFGVEWIPDGETMVGLFRLDNVHKCIKSVLEDKVPGDFIETGVWRGGTCIFMQACLQAYGDHGRNIWLADSFRGLPPPDAEKYPADTGDLHHTYHELIVSREQVEQNFRNYGLLGDNVKFLEGWFKDTLPTAPVEKLAVLRLDGDMYESTMDALNGLYHKLSVGGYAIIDDYIWHKPCAQAVEDFRSRHGITETVHVIDRCGVFWRRER